MERSEYGHVCSERMLGQGVSGGQVMNEDRKPERWIDGSENPGEARQAARQSSSRVDG